MLRTIATLFLSVLAATCAGQAAAGQPERAATVRPNILWITFEDVSSFNIGCYGNRLLSTPNMDSLAAAGIQYMNAWSVAPQCSPARSTLITGNYATSYGMDLHPVPVPTPENIFFPRWLSRQGYYCTNNHKTHYNTTVDHRSVWDESGPEASYNNTARKRGQPFFAVFNSTTSHMGRIRTFHTRGRRDYSREGIRVNDLRLPDYLPDLLEIRSDYAGHLEGIQDADRWIGEILRDLRTQGLDDNTIIFVFSDHGGCLPRGKGYVFETGLRVPLIVYIPPALRRYFAGEYPRKDYSLVNFTDLAPTVLKLAGVRPEAEMRGRPLLTLVTEGKTVEGEAQPAAGNRTAGGATGKTSGETTVPEERRTCQFAFGTNQLHHFMPVRAVTDGRFKYIRSYIPYKQFALRNYYQWGMPSNQAWDRLVLSGGTTDPVYLQPYRAHPAEMLFDLERDPFEQHDLSGQERYGKVLEKMRTALSRHLRETLDGGFFTPGSRQSRPVYEAIRDPDFPLEVYFKLVERAGLGRENDRAFFREYLEHRDPVLRYWAAVGFAQLAAAHRLPEIPLELTEAMHDADPYVAAEAAYACAYAGGQDAAVDRLLQMGAGPEGKVALSLLECISLDPAARDWIRPFIPRLRELGKDTGLKDNENPGVMARGILVNLGALDIGELYGREAFDAGLKLNKGRRKPGPLPSERIQPD